jgi:hypothetical protein
LTCCFSTGEAGMGDALMVRGALAVEISGCEVGCDLELGVKLLRAFMAQLEQC